MDQHGVARRDIGALEQVGPHGEERFGQRRRLDQIIAFGHGQALARGRDRIFGIAAAGQQRADFLPDQLVRAAARRHEAVAVAAARRHRAVGTRPA